MILLMILGVIGLLDALIFIKLMRTFRMLHFYNPEDLPNDNLPSVTICITARNETHAMTQCLERVVATEYPKLEVIVLDDGSRDNTSLLIKSFAHAGVRFVEGRPLPEGWLGKNYAQSLLAQEASGEYVFFMDVDTLIERRTLIQTVRYLQEQQAKMLSVIPMKSNEWQMSTLFTTMRHFWAVIRFREGKPRATANAWLIEREILLDRLANDRALPLSMELETRLARYLAVNHQYRLICSNDHLGVRYEKRWSSQIETSIRLLYPQNGRRWDRVFLLLVLLISTLIPYAALLFTAWAWIVVVLQYLIALYYFYYTWRKYMFIGALVVPVTILQEIILLIISFYRYNFGTITWKGRPITKQ